MIRLICTIFALVLLAMPSAIAAPVVGKSAPTFTVPDSNGANISLEQFKGKTVVLEWTNHDCPFVKKFYNVGKMQQLQEQAKKDGVVWLSIISSAPGKQGHVTAEQANKLTTDRKAFPAHVLLDESGAVGRAYDAKTTPHMFLIDGAGVLRYAGGIDDKPSTQSLDIAEANNYVVAALADLKAGRDVATPQSKPYGCSVKYGK